MVYTVIVGNIVGYICCPSWEMRRLKRGMCLRVDKHIMAMENRRNILNCIINEAPINKAAIAKRVGLSVPSVMKTVDGFIEQGLVRSVGKGRSSGGKPPEMLELISDAHYAVGLDIGRTRLKAVLCDLSGNVVSRMTQPTGNTLPENDLVERICILVENLLSDARVERSRLLGVGVGMPGLIDAENGFVIFSPDFSWEGVPLRDMMEKRLPHHILVENANMAMARGEFMAGAGRGAENVLCVNIGHGIGSGLIQGTEVYRGSSGTSGEFGHITVDKDGPLCHCGNTGCLEALASGEAIARQARNLIASGVRSRILEVAEGDIEQVDAKCVFDAARENDEAAKEIVERATKHIGTLLAGCVNLLDLDRIVLCGGLTKAGDLFLEPVKQTIKKRRMRFAGRKVIVCTGGLGDDAVALGATNQIIQQYILGE